jgi:predicted nucleic acid-binding protein
MICLDASVAVKLILDEEWSDLALALYRATIRSGESIVAPQLLRMEVTNILRQRMRLTGGPSLAEASWLLDRFLALEIAVLNPPGLHQRALALADGLGLPATYDAHYLALAEKQGCEFWTDDRRLIRLAGNRLPYLRCIEDYPVTS